MRLQRYLDVGGLSHRLGRQPVEAHCGRELRHPARTKDRHRPAEAKSSEPDLHTCALQRLRRPAYDLVGRLEEIERVHLPSRCGRVVIGHDRAGIKVRREGFVGGQRKAVADALDLVL